MNVDALLISISPVVVYLLVALVIGLESMGIPLPGEVILVSAALLAARPELDISPIWVALAASAGAIVGDSIGYLAGWRWGVRMFDVLGRRFPRHAGPDRLAYAEHVFTRYGVWAVFFGRFVSLLRTFARSDAGALRIHHPRFLAPNALGGSVSSRGSTAGHYTVCTEAMPWPYAPPAARGTGPVLRGGCPPSRPLIMPHSVLASDRSSACHSPVVRLRRQRCRRGLMAPRSMWR